METIEVTVPVPKFLLAALHLREEDLGRALREAWAVELYRLGHISLGKAAAVAGVETKYERMRVLASEVGADLVVLDDRAARLQAEAVGLRLTGPVGILLTAARQGLLDFQQALDGLLATGFRLGPAEYQRMIDTWKAGKATPP